MYFQCLQNVDALVEGCTYNSVDALVVGDDSDSWGGDNNSNKVY